MAVLFGLYSILTLAVISVVELKAPKGRQPGNARCPVSEWGPCENLNKLGATCGRGTKRGKSTAPGCENVERTEKCKVPCPECKYVRGTFGECDKATMKRVRLDTLDESASHPSCEKQKSVEKACKKNKCKGGRCQGKETTTVGPSQTTAALPGKQKSGRNRAAEKCQRGANGTETCSTSPQSGRGGKKQRGGRQVAFFTKNRGN